MEKLKKGDFIIIKYERKLAHAKVVNPPNKLGRYNVFTQGKLRWLDVDTFVRMGEKDASLKAGEFITNKENLKSVPKIVAPSGESLSPVPDAIINNGVEKLANKIDELAVSEFETAIKSVASVITTDDEMYMAPFRKGKTGKTLTVEQLSDAVGKSTPATKHAVERLVALGYLDLISADIHEYALSIKGLKHIPGTAKPKSEIPKLKTEKSGEVKLSKKNRVLTLLKNPELTVKQIAEMTTSSQSYIRGIKERSAKKMELPEAGTKKREVYDALLLGGTLVEVSKKCKVTISYAYQIRQQMQSAKII